MAVDERTIAVVEGEARELSLVSLSGDDGTLSTVEGASFEFPTTVAVFGDLAWVVDSQFNRFARGAELPSAAELVLRSVDSARL